MINYMNLSDGWFTSLRHIPLDYARFVQLAALQFEKQLEECISMGVTKFKNVYFRRYIVVNAIIVHYHILWLRSYIAIN